MSADANPTSFEALGLPLEILEQIQRVGYETPSPIQAQAIPLLLSGKDLLGQAQTGTGKTAAFALPLLARVDPDNPNPQVLILAPTRELAIQVAEACQNYARGLKRFSVVPIYGGQAYTTQLKQLKRGAHMVVGTPGRVMDHIRKGTLKLDHIQAIVLDEADEMLRMGFIDDVDWILQHTPKERQTALFSATMPKQIRNVAERHLRDPEVIKIAAKTATADSVKQSYWLVQGLQKLDALTRIFETTPIEAAIIFVRTKTATVELAEKLSARGHSCRPLNGDIDQKQREKTVEQLRRGKIDILIATDVAARGLDVPRISHVINYDIPYDTEAYVHRIGRTGRAGKTGEAILFVAPRERRLLRSIENSTKQRIEPLQLPSIKDVNQQRVARFKENITNTLAAEDISLFAKIIEEYQAETETPVEQIAAALAKLSQGKEPLFLTEKPFKKKEFNSDRDRDQSRGRERNKDRDRDRGRNTSPRRLKNKPDVNSERYRIEVGHQHGAKPGQIVGAIANEADINSSYIGEINIYDDYSTVDLPSGMPAEVTALLSKTRVCGQRIALKPFKGQEDAPTEASASKPTPKESEGSKSFNPKNRASVKKNKGKPKRNKDNPIHTDQP